MNNKPKVFLVEDDFINALVMQHYFENLYDFKHIGDGYKVMDILRADPPDVIILDINLGKDDIDGIKLVSEIRNDSVLKNKTVFALTGYAMRGDDELFIKEGFDRYIPKPVDFKLVTQFIEESLAKQKNA